MAKEDDLNVTLSGPDIFVSANQTNVFPIDGGINKKYTSLDKLEARLGRVRAAIKEAELSNRTHDPDYVPEGPMYWNAASFHRYKPFNRLLCIKRLYYLMFRNSKVDSSFDF